MYLLDTNTLSYYFKGIGKVAEHLMATPRRDVAISSIVLYELEVGIGKSNQPSSRKKALKELLRVIPCWVFDDSAARAAAEVRVRSEKRGTPIGPIDTLIAGLALSRSATLVTHNSREFSRVEGLKVVDWY